MSKPTSAAKYTYVPGITTTGGGLGITTRGAGVPIPIFTFTSVALTGAWIAIIMNRIPKKMAVDVFVFIAQSSCLPLKRKIYIKDQLVDYWSSKMRAIKNLKNLTIIQVVREELKFRSVTYCRQ